MVENRDVMDPNAAADSSQILDLGASLTVVEVTEWHSRFATAFEHGSRIEIKAEAIEQIDGAGVQLLVAVIKEALARHIEISWGAVSETLEQAVSQLGLESVFRLPAKGS